jgi:hypothetical protein
MCDVRSRLLLSGHVCVLCRQSAAGRHVRQHGQTHHTHTHTQRHTLTKYSVDSWMAVHTRGPWNSQRPSGLGTALPK